MADECWDDDGSSDVSNFPQGWVVNSTLIDKIIV